MFLSDMSMYLVAAVLPDADCGCLSRKQPVMPNARQSGNENQRSEFWLLLAMNSNFHVTPSMAVTRIG